MSDSIDRKAAIDLVKDVCDAVMSGCESWYDTETGDEVYKDILEVNAILKCNKEVRIALRNMPSAQPKIILCKDCKYGEQDEYGRWYCRGFGCQVGDEDGNGFCSDAERKNNV